MARIETLDNKSASPEAREVFAEIEAAFGMVPNLFRTAAHFPPLLKSNWDKVMAVMMQGELTRKTKETIAVHVSKDNSCGYCVAAHVNMLIAIGFGPEEVERVENDLENADFTEKELALIAFARRANSDPVRLSDAEFAMVKDAGATDAEIVEALGVMEVFTGFNKFLDSLSVVSDFA